MAAPSQKLKGVYWIVEGEILSYYKDQTFRGQHFKAGDCLLRFAYKNKSPMLVYQALKKCIVLCAEPETLKGLFDKHYDDFGIFIKKIDDEVRNEKRIREKLRDRFYSSTVS